jgi:hypothetical protein
MRFEVSKKKIPLPILCSIAVNWMSAKWWHLVTLHPNLPDQAKIKGQLQSYFSPSKMPTYLQDAVNLGVWTYNEWNAGYENVIRMDVSDLHGVGTFALEQIRNGTPIVAVRGELMLKTAIQTIEEQRYTWTNADATLPYMFCLLDEERANVTRCINSCQNTGFPANVVMNWHSGGKLPVVTAKQNIPAGDELLLDYTF